MTTDPDREKAREWVEAKSEDTGNVNWWSDDELADAFLAGAEYGKGLGRAERPEPSGVSLNTLVASLYADSTLYPGLRPSDQGPAVRHYAEGLVEGERRERERCAKVARCTHENPEGISCRELIAQRIENGA